jgi:hypothetical protein
MTTYRIHCRICGEHSTVEAHFISGGGSVRCEDGIERLDLPGYCPNDHRHQEIRSSWNNPQFHYAECA